MIKKDAIAPVSVVIPCFRCGKTIRRALTSIVQQSKVPAEIILVDDASGDDTWSELTELANAYPGWIKLLRFEENQGAASARNAGWAAATQAYVAFLDADDSWNTEKLHVQYAYMRDNPEVSLCGHRCVLLQDEEALPVLQERFHSTKINATSLLFRNAFFTPSVMLKRDIRHRFQKRKRFAEDFLLWQQIAFSGLNVVRIESPLAYIHKSPYGAGGLSAQLWRMETGELGNFVTLYRAGSINTPLYVAASLFSMIKFVRRLLLARLSGLSKMWS